MRSSLSSAIAWISSTITVCVVRSIRGTFRRYENEQRFWRRDQDVGRVLEHLLPLPRRVSPVRTAMRIRASGTPLALANAEISESGASRFR